MDVLSEFRTLAIAAHCLGHSGTQPEKTEFDDLQKCQFTFCRERYRLHGEAVREAGPVKTECLRCVELHRAIATLSQFITQL